MCLMTYHKGSEMRKLLLALTVFLGLSVAPSAHAYSSYSHGGGYGSHTTVVIHQHYYSPRHSGIVVVPIVPVVPIIPVAPVVVCLYHYHRGYDGICHYSYYY